MKKRTGEPVEGIENTPPWDKVLEMGKTEVLERQRRFLELGIIDEEGRRTSLELPPDMRLDSKTSV